MKIRSITLFSPTDPRRAKDPRLVLLERARTALIDAGYEVQTLRLALGDPAQHLPERQSGAERRRGWLELGSALEELVSAGTIAYASAGAFVAQDELAAEVPALLANTRHVFCAASMSDEHGVDLTSVRRLGQVVHENSTLEPDGFANLRFAALSNVPAGVPFLPAAYHGDGEATIAVAAECADLVVTAFAEATDCAAARTGLIAAVEGHGRRIEAALSHAIPPSCWRGIDFSPAPYPSTECSLARALESLGIARLGQHGSTAAAAFLASALDAARFRRAGFNGLFFPVLEDEQLAARSASLDLGLQELLLWSTVCGTGLDTVPLPGDTGPPALSAILLDVAALGVRLCKPLTARLMPMPGRIAGDRLSFDFPFFAAGAVLPHAAMPLQGALAASQHLPIARRAARAD